MAVVWSGSEIAREAWLELTCGERGTDDALIEAIAECVRPDLAADLAVVVEAQGAKLKPRPDLPEPHEGVLIGTTIYVLATLPGERKLIAVLHELAHLVLRRDRHCDPHGDVWRLTLALAAPKSLLARLRSEGRLDAVSLSVETGLPWWASEMRLMISVSACGIDGYQSRAAG